MRALLLAFVRGRARWVARLWPVAVVGLGLNAFSYLTEPRLGDLVLSPGASPVDMDAARHLSTVVLLDLLAASVVAHVGVWFFVRWWRGPAPRLDPCHVANGGGEFRKGLSEAPLAEEARNLSLNTAVPPCR